MREFWENWFGIILENSLWYPRGALSLVPPIHQTTLLMYPVSGRNRAPPFVWTISVSSGTSLPLQEGALRERRLKIRLNFDCSSFSFFFRKPKTRGSKMLHSDHVIITAQIADANIDNLMNNLWDVGVNENGTHMMKMRTEEVGHILSISILLALTHIHREWAREWTLLIV